jgi:hypothetical protein
MLYAGLLHGEWSTNIIWVVLCQYRSVTRQNYKKNKEEQRQSSDDNEYFEGRRPQNAFALASFRTLIQELLFSPGTGLHAILVVIYKNDVLK